MRSSRDYQYRYVGILEVTESAMISACHGSHETAVKRMVREVSRFRLMRWVGQIRRYRYMFQILMRSSLVVPDAGSQGCINQVQVFGSRATSFYPNEPHNPE